MRIFAAQTTVPYSPDRVLRQLTEPDAIARHDRLALVADSPISLDVDYAVYRSAPGSDIRASISVKGNGILGRLLAKATEALQAAGALQSSLNRPLLSRLSHGG